MKKGIVILLVGLALIVLISPGLVGKLAERNIDQSIRAGTVQNEDIVVTASVFERGWFTTEGQHRIELKGGDLSDDIREFFELDADVPLPVLVIDTRVDHGLIPLGSMGREDGSLTPGLGDAISTLHLEMPDGRTIDLPGAVNSRVGLTGRLVSDYTLAAGSIAEDDVDIAWDDVSIGFTAAASTGRVSVDVDIASLELGENSGHVAVRQLRFSGEQQPSAFGYALGGGRIEIEAIEIKGREPLGPFLANGDARIEDDRLHLDFAMDFSSRTRDIGNTRTILETTLTDVDPEAFGHFYRKFMAMPVDAAQTPEQLAALLEPEARALLAGGLSLDLPRFELTLPDGTLESTLELQVAAVDPDDFVWSGLMLDTEASADVRIPEPLMDFVLATNPEAGAAIGMGFLKKDGDTYVSEIRYAKGILAVNGAPVPIPLPAP